MGRSPLYTLADRLDADRVGAKAANLARLRAWGYAVPAGWIWQAGDDRDQLLRAVQPSPEQPVIVRSSAVGEDSLQISAAGQYDSIGDVVDRTHLDLAIDRCLASYSKASAIAYRRDRAVAVEDMKAVQVGLDSDTSADLADLGVHTQPANHADPTNYTNHIAMSLLVQRQIKGVLSGVVFSRDPVAANREAVAIEVVAGGASALVSGRVTPARYSVTVPDTIPEEIPPLAIVVEGRIDRPSGSSQLPWLDDLAIDSPQNSPAHPTEPFPEVPADRLRELLQSVAAIARQLERRDHGTPQDIEWTYDGQTLWLLQARPISTLYPIWTRRIAAEVAPGAVHPLSWSISQPLTCGVWGAIFTTVLGDRAVGLDFSQTATLHGSHAYFNASLLGDIFRRMGLPPESLEFLVRDRSMSRPSFRTLLINLPGLLRLVGQQFRLVQRFEADDRGQFTPLLDDLAADPIDLNHPHHSPQSLFDRIDRILAALQPATRYNILAPIGLAIRQKLAKIEDLDSGMMPEVQATRAFQALAETLYHHLDRRDPGWETRDPIEDLRSWLSGGYLIGNTPQNDGQALLDRFDQWLTQYGYLSDVGTNIAIPTWREMPDHWLRLWWQAAKALKALATRDTARDATTTAAIGIPTTPPAKTSGSRSLQEFARLKGRVAEVYDRLLAELRWCFVALEYQGKAAQMLPEALVLEKLNQEDLDREKLGLEPLERELLRLNELGLEQSERGSEFQLSRMNPNLDQSSPEITNLVGDIFWLTIAEIRQIFTLDYLNHSESSKSPQSSDADHTPITPQITSQATPALDVPRLIHDRRTQFDRDRQCINLPRLVYGAALPDRPTQPITQTTTGARLTGIGASRGQARGRLVLMAQFDPCLVIDRDTILVVPYTDAGWSPLLVQAGGLISAVGGRLSHGAIVAREYGIPAVMDVADAFTQLQSGQWVQIDGERGTIERIEG